MFPTRALLSRSVWKGECLLPTYHTEKKKKQPLTIATTDRPEYRPVCAADLEILLQLPRPEETTRLIRRFRFWGLYAQHCGC